MRAIGALTSPRTNPKSGFTSRKPSSSTSMPSTSIASASPGSAPSMRIGPVAGLVFGNSSLKSGALAITSSGRRSLPVRASCVSISSSAGGPTASSGGCAASMRYETRSRRESMQGFAGHAVPPQFAGSSAAAISRRRVMTPAQIASETSAMVAIAPRRPIASASAPISAAPSATPPLSTRP